MTHLLIWTVTDAAIVCYFCWSNASRSYLIWHHGNGTQRFSEIFAVFLHLHSALRYGENVDGTEQLIALDHYNIPKKKKKLNKPEPLRKIGLGTLGEIWKLIFSFSTPFICSYFRSIATICGQYWWMFGVCMREMGNFLFGLCFRHSNAVTHTQHAIWVFHFVNQSLMRKTIWAIWIVNFSNSRCYLWNLNIFIGNQLSMSGIERAS